MSCASEILESETQEIKTKISTAIDIEQVKVSTDQNLSRSEDRAPEMRTFNVKARKVKCSCVIRLQLVFMVKTCQR